MTSEKLRFLIADDHEVVRRGLRDILEDAFPGVDVGEAASAAAALELAIKRPWDLVILDINMPGRSGIDMLADIKKAQPRLPVLMLSIAPESEYAVRALRQGADGYVPKQSVGVELVAAVRKVLGGGRYVTPAMAEKLADTLRRGQAGPPHESLSEREYQVMKLLARGLNAKQIAAELSLGEKTIFTYRTRLLEKLGLRNDVEVARYVLQNHLDS